jgi:surface antigen
VAVCGFVVGGQQNAVNTTPQNAILAAGTDNTAANPLDQLSSADIAVNIAKATNLDEHQAVANKADTVNAQLAVSSADQSIVPKPQVISVGLKSRKDIQTYTTKAGDSVTSIATQFGVTSDTIRWSNGVTGDAIAAGTSLRISPVSGIVYQVKAGDTADSLASKYRSNKDLLVAINDAEFTFPGVGEYIVIPDGQPPTATGRVSVTTAAASGGFAWGGYSAIYEGNGYDFGYCTWYAATRRSQIGRPIPSNLGNASTWKVLAQRAGLGVGNAPAAGAVLWVQPRDYYGHVGFVESVNPDGSVNISEMNVYGFAVRSTKTIPADEAGNYSYIY